MAFNIEDFLDRFVDEAGKHIHELNTGLLELEKEPENEELVHTLFRSAHTIKGSANMMNLETIASYAHGVENVLSAYRDKKISLEKQHIDTLLLAVDSLSQMIQQAAHHEEISQPTANMMNRLDSILQPQDGGEDAAAETRPVKGSAEKFAQTAEAANGSAKASAEKIPEIGSAEKSAQTAETANGGAEASAEKPEKQFTDITENKLADTEDEQKTGAQHYQQESMVIRTKKVEDVIQHIDELIIHNKNLTAKLEQLVQIERGARQELLDDLHFYSRVNQDLLDSLYHLQMVPISMIFDRLPLFVRNTSSKFNKEIDFSIKGGETELDKRIIDRLERSLLHLLRNAIDHGIEAVDTRREMGKTPKGHIRLAASYERGQCRIEISDDGKGIQLEKLLKKAAEKGDSRFADRSVDEMDSDAMVDLLAVPGISSVDYITDLSGRGVGMDVVVNEIEKELGGSVHVKSKQGEGTVFELFLPLSAAIMDITLIRLGGNLLAIPSSAVVEMISIDREEIIDVVEKKAVRLRDQIIPVVDISGLFETSLSVVGAGGSSGGGAGGGSFGGGAGLGSSGGGAGLGSSGAASGGSFGGGSSGGSSGVSGGSPYSESSVDADTEHEAFSLKREMLIVTSGREHIGILITELLRQERGIIRSLPAHLSSNVWVSGCIITKGFTIVPVLHTGKLIEYAKQTQKQSESLTTGGGSTGRTAKKSKKQRVKHILVVDDSISTRDIEKSILESFGYKVSLAGDGGEALEMIRNTSYDIVISDIEMPNMDGFALTEHLKNDEALSHLPVILVTSRDKETDRLKGMHAGADAYIVKQAFDQSHLIETIRVLIG